VLTPARLHWKVFPFFSAVPISVWREKSTFQLSWAFVIVETQKKKSENAVKKIDELSTTEKFFSFFRFGRGRES
jgi:hypothetical protein